MHNLKAVAVEHGAIVATAEDGTQFRIQLDDELRSKLRGTPTGTITTRRSTPREIQTYIRGGMSAEQVAKYTGAQLEYVQRYELPILAERQYMVESALGVHVLSVRPSDESDGPPTFGSVLDERLEQLSATGTRWASWKEPEGGWIVKLSFTADGIDHDARWSFDPKKQHLTPLNGEATALSQQDDIGTTLLPRLRAVAPELPDASRFDSAAFEFPLEEGDVPDPVVPVDQTPTGRIRIPTRTGSLPVIRGEQPPAPEPADTADLLETLRRRRGEREAADYDEPAEPTQAPGGLRVLERVRTEQVETTEVRPAKTVPVPTKTGPIPKRRGRTSMPSWDEIVFGARPEDDPA